MVTVTFVMFGLYLKKIIIRGPKLWIVVSDFFIAVVGAAGLPGQDEGGADEG